MWQTVSELITAHCGYTLTHIAPQSIGGGCINSAYKLADQKHVYFVKTNTATQLEMFEAEYEGLKEIQASGTLRVPLPIGVGQSQGHAFIVMEYLDLDGRTSGQSAAQLGIQLAQMHQQSMPTFGWHRDNTIGSTPQHNQLTSDWVAFWRQHRLGFQLALAAEQGYNGRLQQLGERLLADLEIFFSSYQPQPALLHGDLWSGNYASMRNGQPVIFDPAVYYGDREADIAMTELFGGFAHEFYRAYNDTWVLDDGYTVRKTLYNLYHIINHLNLFGSGYQRQAESMMQRLLAEI